MSELGGGVLGGGVLGGGVLEGGMELLGGMELEGGAELLGGGVLGGGELGGTELETELLGGGAASGMNSVVGYGLPRYGSDPSMEIIPKRVTSELRPMEIIMQRRMGDLHHATGSHRPGFGPGAWHP